MRWKALIMKKVAGWLIGKNVLERIQEIVSSLMRGDGTGEEKRKVAIARVRALGYDIGDYLINLAVEVSVTYLKSKA
jgi:hypothetical protein